MGRKTNKTPTRIWSFYCRPPAAETAALVRENLFLANRYYNALIEVERQRAARYQEIRRTHAPTLAALEDAYAEANLAVDAAYDAIQSEKARIFRQTGKRVTAIPVELKRTAESMKAVRHDLSAQLKQARDEFKALLAPAKAELKARRDSLKKERANTDGKTAPLVIDKINAETSIAMLAEEWPEAWKDEERNDVAALGAKKLARRNRPIGTGTGGLVEEAVENAIHDARPALPRFRRFDETGRLGGQIREGGCATAVLLSGKHSQIRLRQLAPKPSKRTGVVGRHANEFYVVSVNIGSRERGLPVWIDLPCRIHRPLPNDGVVKYAWILVRRTGTQLRYDFQMMIEAESFATEQRRPVGEGKVAVNFGWRKVSGGIRVAYWADEFGDHGSIVVPTELPDADTFEASRRPRVPLASRIAYSHVLESFADDNLTRAQRVARAWVARAGNFWPKHVVDRTWSDRTRDAFVKAVRNWAREIIGADRIEQLWSTWKRDRVAAGQDLFVRLNVASRWARSNDLPRPEQRVAWWFETWGRKERHLRQYAAFQRCRAQRQRDAFYRKEAIRLATKYGELITDNSKMNEMAKRAAPDEEEKLHEQARRNRQAMAPGRLREIMREIFGSRAVEPVSAEGNSTRCAECGKRMRGRPEESTATCPDHGPVDVDLNNCRNLLKRMTEIEQSGSDGNGGGARNAD